VNPYFNRGAIADPKYFFGREEILSHIWAALNAPKPQNISIEGERRIGKSSLLNYLMHQDVRKKWLTLPDKYVLVLTDFLDYQPQSAADFIRTLHYYLCLELEQSNNLDLCAQAQSALQAMESFSAKDTRRLKEALKRHLMDLKKQGYHVVFLIDEADSVFLRARLDYGVFDFMRSLSDVSRYYSVSYIIASRRPLREISKALVASKFHNTFEVHKLGLFSHEEALELIRTPSQRAGVAFTTQEEDILLGLAGNHPFTLQVACYYLFEQKVTGHLIDARALADAVYSQLIPCMEDWWEDSSSEEQHLLHAIITGSSSSTEFPLELLHRLLERGLVVKEGVELRCFSQLFTRFVREKAQIIDETPEAGDSRHLYLSSQIKEWLKQGEGQTIEFKREIPGNITQLAKTIAAFASGEGGVVIIGIEDDGTVCGIPVYSALDRDRFRQRVYGVATKVVKPPVGVEIDFLKVHGKVVSIIQVPPGTEPLYYVESRPYVRYGSINQSPEPDEVRRRYATAEHDRPGHPIGTSSFLKQQRQAGLREEVWRVIETVELQLRQFIAGILRQKVGEDWEQFLSKRHPELYEQWTTIQGRHQRAFKRYGAVTQPSETILDYSFVGDLGTLVVKDWEIYRHILDFGRSSSKENKRYWVEMIETITRVRNALAHHRFVPENELKRVEVFCNDIAAVLSERYS